jgi:hypothetical protein
MQCVFCEIKIVCLLNTRVSAAEVIQTNKQVVRT